MRKKIVAGNWKMNKTFQEAEELLYDISDLLTEEKESDADVLICPPFIFLELAGDVSQEGEFFVGAQNLNNNESGAFTGEISAHMLKSIEVEYCIIGHSERRKYYGETDDIVKQKVEISLKNKITPLVCCGEILADREKEKHYKVVQSQLEQALFHLSPEDFSRIIIAYEPVWAIGTGVNATPEQAQEMHAFIRDLIARKYSDKIAQNTSILYGGSCNSGNAEILFAQKDVDGGLIGGASLKAEEFIKIINSF